MPREIDLIKLEETAAIILIMGYLVFYTSAKQSEELELEIQPKPETNATQLNPAQLTALSSWIRVFGIVLLTYIAIARFNQRVQSIQSGQSSSSIIPNIYITSGSIISLVGFIILTIGAQLRANEPGTNITLI